MKKTLIAAAALTAMAASAMAADVTLYGQIDTGLKFTQNQMKLAGEKATDRVTAMDTGIAGGNRWGIKGTEKLGKNYTFGFVLEGGFNADSGLDSNSNFFRRQSEINLTGPFGKFAFGRMGTITGGTNGGIMHGKMSGFGTAYADLGATSDLFTQIGGSRVDNAWRYDTPKFGGLQLTVQYSDCIAQSDNEGTSNSESYAGAVLQYNNGPLGVALSAAQRHQGHDFRLEGEPKNQQSYDVTFNYDFGPAKLYLAYQMNTDVDYLDGVDSNVYQISADFKAGAGTLMTTLGFKDGDEFLEHKAWRVGVAYKYPFSKRTYMYAAAAYKDAKSEEFLGVSLKQKTTSAAIGLHHSF